MLRLYVLLSVAASALAQTFDVREHQATKTVYGFPRDTSDTPPPEGCQAIPSSLHVIARHGSRYPTSGSIGRSVSFEEYIDPMRDLIPEEFAWLRTWKASDDYDARFAGELNDRGMMEHFGIGQRLARRFDGAWHEPVSVDFTSTQVRRTSISGTSFYQGVFEGQGPLEDCMVLPAIIFSESQAEDRLLYYYKNCAAYVQSQERDAELREAEPAAWAAKNFPEIGARLAESLNLPEPVPIEYLPTLFDMCGFDIALYNNTDHFCTMFQEEEWLTLEYHEDLQKFWIQGPSLKINSEQSANLLAQLVTEFQDEEPRSTFRFAHSETIATFYGFLDLFYDGVNLTADADPEFIANRRWRTSHWARFASNAQFLVHQCSSDDGGDDIRVRLLINEEETLIPGCGELYCPITSLLSAWAPKLEITYDEACTLPIDRTVGSAPGGLVISNLAITIIAVGAVVLLLVIAWFAYLMHRRRWRAPKRDININSVEPQRLQDDSAPY